MLADCEKNILVRQTLPLGLGLATLTFLLHQNPLSFSTSLFCLTMAHCPYCNY